LVRDEVDDPDRVVEGRMMAHDRLPPPGYLEGFRANVEVVGAGRVVVEPRAVPLTDAEIVAHEARFRRR
jgi:arabinofuranosyltransferase